jgi:50S ribosomal subunit-associated GTPase HflX
MESNVGSVNAILGELSFREKPIVLLMNKRDRCRAGTPPQEGALWISAKSGEGIPELLSLIEEELWFHRPQSNGSTSPA